MYSSAIYHKLRRNMEELEKADCHSEDDAGKILKEFLDEDDPFVDDDNDPDWVEEYTSKGNKLRLDVVPSNDLSVKSKEKSDPMIKKRKRIQREDRDEGKGSDDEHVVKERRLLIGVDDEEKKDMDEISLLLSIRDSVQAVAQTQDKIVDLIVDFVKNRQSL
ncbi:uncharacterized protein [Palaemon carinicauda]|uniref:uncharacterized protein n=1 Tax=Palaemon carinicauda TaxID=392227 RepID=UPI0035B64FA2